MKQFEVGKTYKGRPYSYTKDGRRNYKYPQTMTVVSRTDWYIRVEIKWGINNKSNRSYRVSKRTNVEQIDDSGRFVTANDEA